MSSTAQAISIKSTGVRAECAITHATVLPRTATQLIGDHIIGAPPFRSA